MLLQIKDIKLIEWDFDLTPMSCPRGGTFGTVGAHGIKLYFFENGYVTYQIDGDN